MSTLDVEFISLAAFILGLLVGSLSCISYVKSLIVETKVNNVHNEKSSYQGYNGSIYFDTSNYQLLFKSPAYKGRQNWFYKTPIGNYVEMVVDLTDSKEPIFRVVPKSRMEEVMAKHLTADQIIAFKELEFDEKISIA